MNLWYILVPVTIQSLALPFVELSPGILTTDGDEAPEPLLQKPKGDPRQYQHSVLENGLRVVNIVDPNTTQAAVAVAVTVGSFSDPEGFDGLAHLLEHSMFLGSQNFPERSGFDAWLAQNGGSSNAYTAEEQTVFYASVSGKALAETMKRYADIFSRPGFNASWVWDEVQAVDSEHNKNRKSQEWRVESLINLMAAEKPMVRFHTGNVQTLRSTNQKTLAAKIEEFFAQHYCPPRMRLVTFGAPSLEWQLGQAQATFGQIPRQGQGCGEAAPSFQGVVPYPSSSLQQLLRMQGLTPKPELHLVFPMQNLRPWIRSNPTAYLQHILTFAGKDSLLLALRDQLNVASSLSVNREDSSAGSKIVVSLSLLPEGVERLPAVLDAFFSFIARARSGTSNAKLEVLRSLAESAQVGYDWSALEDASRAAFEVADDMTKLGASDLLVADNLILEPDVTKVDYILNRLRPEHMLLVLVDTEQSSYWQGGQPDARLLPFYDVNYTIRPLETTWTEWQRWRQGSTNVDPFKSTTSLDQRVAEVKSQFFLKVPGAIAGLPENLTQEAAPMKGSGQLGELWGDLPKRMELKAFANIDLDLWHRENWMLRQPRVTARLTLRRPQNAKGYSAKNVVDAEIGLRILNELMSARLANLTDLGTTWKIETGSSQSFTVLLSSFAVNAKEHFAQVLTELVQEDEKAAAAERRLVRLRRELKMELEDQSEAILSVAVRQRNVLLMPQTFARHELLSALVEGAAGTTQEALDVLKARRLGNLSMTGLVMGSCSLQLAEELQDKMLTQLGVGGGKVDLIDANRSERVDRVVRYSHPLELRGRNPRNDSSHAMLMTIMVGPSSIKQRVLLGLISEVLNEVAFKVLRTELQLGYVAGGSVSAISNILTVSCFDLGGAIELPCSCTVPYCQQCWDRTLAASLSKVGLPRCPSCRMVVRPDYDAQLGRLVFSRVADASVRYENWLESLDETLRQHGVSRCDEGTKFIARTQAGHLTKLFVMFAFQETAEVQGRLWQSLQRRKEEMNQEKWFTENEWFVTNQQGEEVSAPREPSEAEFPLQVRYPKTVERPVTELDASSFPLTLTFKEYVVSIDHRPAAGGAGDVLSTFDFRSEGSKGVVVVRDNVGAAKRWKDSSTSVCLHPGDRILEVNGSTEGSEILDQLGRAELLKVRLQQKGSIFKTDVFNPEDDMRNRLQSQAKPRQQELLQRRGASDPPLCVCGGQLKLLELRERVKLLVDSDGFLEYAGRRFSVEDLIQMSAVSCDLCHRSIREERPRLWTCQNGANTILHAQSYDVCEQCFNSCSEH